MWKVWAVTWFDAVVDADRDRHPALDGRRVDREVLVVAGAVAAAERTARSRAVEGDLDPPNAGVEGAACADVTGVDGQRVAAAGELGLGRTGPAIVKVGAVRSISVQPCEPAAWPMTSEPPSDMSVWPSFSV